MTKCIHHWQLEPASRGKLCAGQCLRCGEIRNGFLNVPDRYGNDWRDLAGNKPDVNAGRRKVTVTS